MGPGQTRLLIWSVPTVAIFFSLLWYRRKRAKTTKPSTPPIPIPQKSQEDLPQIQSQKHLTQLEATKTPIKEETKPQSTPFSRSLSGVESAPIDIKTNRSPPLVVSDKDLDIEIQKIKSLNSSTMAKTKTSPTPTQSQSSISSTEGTPSSGTPEKTPKTPTTTPIITKAGKKSLNKEATNFRENNRNSANHTKETSRKSPGINRDSANRSPPGINIRDSPNKEVTNFRENSRQSPGINLRDSANHSPADAMLASPSCSIASDGHHSDSDSGKGGSDIATPPPQNQAPKIMIHEFVIPQILVGRLIGRHGSFVHQIKDKTNANILIKRHPGNMKGMKVCSIEGSKDDIDHALEMIRDKFPEKRYPDLNLEHVGFDSAVSLVPESMHLKLVEGINNDTIVSCMFSPRHLFLQQPTHPTFPSLNVLSAYMNACYSQENLEQPPHLPQPIKENTICAAHSLGAWYRAIILSTENESCNVKFLDYGGYATLDQSMLRQIRGDFLLLPFQSSECLLANVSTLCYADDGTELWPQEAYDLVAELTKGAVVYTQIVDYLEDLSIPLVYIYVRAGEHFLFLNKELVNRGLAVWEENVHSTNQTSVTNQSTNQTNVTNQENNA